MADLIRASSLVNIPGLIEKHGGNATALLAEAGVSPTLVGDYNRFIPYSALTTLVGRASEELELPDFGLRASRVQNMEMLGPIAVLARNAETVGAALDDVIRYLHTYSPAIRAGLITDGRFTLYTFAITPARMPYRKHLIELALGVTLGMFRLMTSPDFRPELMTFQHAAMSGPEVYSDYFEAPARFQAEHNALVFPTGLLDRRIDGRDVPSLQVARRYLASRVRHGGLDEHVYELIDKLLPLGQGDLESVAAELAMHPRVLQRKLAALGTSFARLTEDWRREVALELLDLPDLTMSEIASQLGYSEQSVFTRSFKKWFGTTPLVYRRRHLVTDPARTADLSATHPD